MNALENRLEKLEAENSKSDGLKMLVQDEGESRNECIRRHGHNPDERGEMYILASWLDVAI